MIDHWGSVESMPVERRPSEAAQQVSVHAAHDFSTELRIKSLRVFLSLAPLLILRSYLTGKQPRA